MLNFFRKKDREKNTCTQNCQSCTQQTDCSGRQVRFSIKVLGSNCQNCHTLYENAKNLTEKKALSAHVEYSEDLQEIITYGIVSTPALIVNGKLLSAGKVLTEHEMEELLRELEQNNA